MREEPAHVTPFGTLLHFKKDIEQAQPRVLLVAPLSGHFATLLRSHRAHHAARARRLHHRLAQRARRAGSSDGAFGFDDYVEHLIEFLEVMGPGAHVIAVCQPCVAVLVAAAVMAQNGNPGAAAQHDADGGADRHPRQSDQGERAGQSKPIAWFEKNLIATRAVALSPARSGGSIRASCSSPPS